MKPSLQTGLTATARYDVDEARTIGFMGEDLRVYATPSLVRDIELTCRDLLLAHSDPDEDSVGTVVNVEHLAATPLGLWAEIAVTVTEVAGRRVSFSVTARDPVDAEIARGTHTRFVVDKGKTRERILAKKDKAQTL